MFQIFTVWDWVGSAVGLEMPVKTEGWANFQFHRDKQPYYYISLAMLIIVTAALWWLRGSRIGFILRGIRDDEEAVRISAFPAALQSIAMAISSQSWAAGVFHRSTAFVDPSACSVYTTQC